MSERIKRYENTPRAKKMWDAVDKAAAKAPKRLVDRMVGERAERDVEERLRERVRVEWLNPEVGWEPADVEEVTVGDIREGRVRLSGTEERMGMREALEWAMQSLRDDAHRLAHRREHRQKVKVAATALSLLTKKKSLKKGS